MLGEGGSNGWVLAAQISPFPTAPERDGAKAVPEGWREPAESHGGTDTGEDSLQGQGKGWEMPGICVPMFSLGSSQLILGGKGRRERNRKSFPPPLPGPLPELQFPLGGDGDGDARPACAWSSSEPAAKSETAPRDSPIPAELGAKGRSGSRWLERMAAHQKSSLSGQMGKASPSHGS